jgi:thiamine biosynthesis lipoprotein
MGMPISVHARGDGARDAATADAVAELFEDLRAADARFSTYREDSEIRRLQRGELTLDDSSAEMREVERLCRTARERTAGSFDAWSAHEGTPGVFDPTGLVKTWAVTRAARRLDPLEHLAFAVGAGGDVLLRPGTEGHTWSVGIEDPQDRRRVIASVPISSGGIATSGVAARGSHIVDPRNGRSATDLLSATVIGPSLLWADIFATASVALGLDAIGWVETLHGTSGLLVLADGTVHRWQNEA